MALWATDLWHHISPAAVGAAIGLLLALPGVGVLDLKAIKAVNFMLIVFAGGVVSMANVLTATQALTSLAALIGTWHETLFATAWHAALTLYWGGFLYHFPAGFDWRSIEQHPTFVTAVQAGKSVGLHVQLQGTPGKPALPPWTRVPQSEVPVEPGKLRTWPAIWSPDFQSAFPAFVKALAKRYDGDPRLAYVVMTEGTTIPYAATPQRWASAGYSAARYSQAYQQLYQTYLQAFQHTPLVAAMSAFGQESRQVLHGSAEAQALHELLDFAGQRGLHFLVPESYTRQATTRIYVRDELVWPVLRQYATRSHLLGQLDPGKQRTGSVDDQTLQRVQAMWPDLPVRGVLLTR